MAPLFKSEGIMNKSFVSSIVSAIPERVARLQSGSVFMLPDAGAGDHGGNHGAQVAHLARFLQWLSPLESISKEDQELLGLLAAHGKPALHGVDEDEGEEPENEAAPARSRERSSAVSP
jgi:hypothetical protein